MLWDILNEINYFYLNSTMLKKIKSKFEENIIKLNIIYHIY